MDKEEWKVEGSRVVKYNPSILHGPEANTEYRDTIVEIVWPSWDTTSKGAHSATVSGVHVS